MLIAKFLLPHVRLSPALSPAGRPVSVRRWFSIPERFQRRRPAEGEADEVQASIQESGDKSDDQTGSYTTWTCWQASNCESPTSCLSGPLPFWHHLRRYSAGVPCLVYCHDTAGGGWQPFSSCNSPASARLLIAGSRTRAHSAQSNLVLSGSRRHTPADQPSPKMSPAEGAVSPRSYPPCSRPGTKLVTCTFLESRPELRPLVCDREHMPALQSCCEDVLSLSEYSQVT